MLKKLLIPLLLILFMASMVALGAPVYVNIGPTTEFDGDIKILSEIVAEGTTVDGWKTTIFFTDPTADRTITIPDYDVTIGSAILLTVTDNENTNENNAILFTSGGVEAGVLNIESDGGDFYYNPSDGSLHVTLLYGDGSNITGVGAAAATALTFTAKEENTGNIVKGQAVYISGAVGAAFPTIGLADGDDANKIRIVGLAAENITQNTTGLVRRAGLLIGVDTLGANAVNPNDEAWAAGDLLYIDDVAGGLTNVKPTSGRIVKAAYTLYGSSNTDDLLVFPHENPVYIACAPGEDIILRMGDAVAANKIYFKDYANVEVAFIDSDGKADFTSLTLDTALLIAEGGTNSAAALTNDRVIVSSGGAIIHSATITVTELGLLNGLTNTIVTDNNACTDIEGTGLSIAGGVLNWAAPVNSIDSAAYVDASIDHEHLHNDVIHGMTIATLAAADEFLFWDDTPGALRKITWTNLMGSIGLANLASSTSANLASTLSDEIGTGKARFDTSVTAKTGVGTLNISEAGTIKVSAAAAYTLTLPTASGNTGLTYHFIKTDANYNLITLDGDGAETFNYENSTSAPTLTYIRLNTYCAEVTIVSDGSNWQVIDEAMGQIPECYAHVSGQMQDLVDNTILTVWLNAELYDIGSNFNNSTWVSGTATSTSANHLVDSSGAFTAAMVGYRIKNTTDTTYAYITVYNSATDVTVSSDIFVNGEAYDLINSKYIIPVSGKYQLISKIQFVNTIADKSYSSFYYINDVLKDNSINQTALADALSNIVNKIYSFSKDDVVVLKTRAIAGVNTVDIYGDEDNTSLVIRLISKD